MICEPNFNLPQKIDISDIRKAEELQIQGTEEKALKTSDTVKHKVSYVQNNYTILPKFYDQFDHLNTILSLRSNEYLSCRWNQFLNNVPEDYVRIKLYCDYMKEREIRNVKPKRLNGKFYGVDNKLAPIPQLSDPRKLSKH